MGITPPAAPFRIGLDFGVRYRQPGWGQGLTIHTCLMNLLPRLDATDRLRAGYHGLAAVAGDCAGMPPRFGVQPLPTTVTDPATLKRWFRQFVEVRDPEGEWFRRQVGQQPFESGIEPTIRQRRRRGNLGSPQGQ